MNELELAKPTSDVALKPEDFRPETRNISNSEVTTFLACKRMYNFNFIDNLAPIKTSDPLTRGSLGHLAFEYYIKARLNGSFHERAYSYAMSAFSEAMQIMPERIDLIMETQILFTRYMEYHQGWPEWELLGTEERLDLELTESINIAIRYDVKVRERTTGKILLGDWKFTFDFWTDDEHMLNPQMPKYIAVMRMNNIQIDGGFLEQVRTRKLSKANEKNHKMLWRRSFYWPSNARLQSAMGQHVLASLEIEKHRALSPEDRDIVSIPVYNKHGACKYCNYKDLCISMTEGKKDLTVDKRVNYRPNTYGYNQGQTVPGTLETPTDLKELL